MTLLIASVLVNEVEVFATDDDGTVHLGRHHGTGEDTTTDGDEAGERARFVKSSVSARPSAVLSFPNSIYIPI